MAKLTPEQEEFLRGHLDKLPAKKIARKLGLSVEEVRNHQRALKAQPKPSRGLARMGPSLVAIVAVVAFANSMPGGFVFDDGLMIQRNPAIRDGLGAIPELFQHNYWYPANPDGMLYRPLTSATYALNYAWGSLEPLGYHALNVVLHSLICVLIFLILRSRYTNHKIAWASSLLFAVHPVHSEAVANIIGRAELLATAAVLGGWYLCRHGSDFTFQKRLTREIAASALFLLGLLSKESAVVLPAILLLDDLTRSQASLSNPRERFRALLRPAYLGFAIALVIYLLLRSTALGSLAGRDLAADLSLDNPLRGVPFYPRILSVVKIFGLYLRVLVWPLNLSPDYSFNQISQVQSPADAGFILALVACLLVLGLCFLRWEGRRPFVFPVLFFGITLLPVSNMLVTIGTIYGERLVYLPSIGVCLGLGIVYAKLAERIKGGKALFLAGVIVIHLLGGMTLARNRVWKSNLTLFGDAVVAAPQSAKVHAMYAEALINTAGAQRLGEAEAELMKAIEIYPDYAQAYQNLGYVHLTLGQGAESRNEIDAAALRYGNAIRAFQSAIRSEEKRYSKSDPDSWPSGRERDTATYHYSLGNAYLYAGDNAEALKSLNEALRRRPDYADALTSRGLVLYRLENVEAAIADFEAALRLQPGHRQARSNLDALRSAAPE